MKKITIYIEDDIPETVIHPFVPQYAATDLSYDQINKLEAIAYEKGYQAARADYYHQHASDLIEVIELVNTSNIFGSLPPDNHVEKCECDQTDTTDTTDKTVIEQEKSGKSKSKSK